MKRGSFEGAWRRRGHLFSLKGAREQPPREAGGFPGGQFVPGRPECCSCVKWEMCKTSLRSGCHLVWWGVRRQPGAQHPAWRGADTLVAVGTQPLYPRASSPAPPHQSSPTPPPHQTSTWLLTGLPTSPRDLVLSKPRLLPARSLPRHLALYGCPAVRAP